MTTSTETTIPRRWLPFVRVAVILLMAIAWLAAFRTVPVRSAELSRICSAASCPSLVLTPGDLEALEGAGFSLGAYAALLNGAIILLLLMYWGLVLILVIRRSDTWMGNVAAVALSYFGLIGVIGSGFESLELNQRILISTIDIISWLSLMLLVYLFPSGRFVPGWTRWFYAGTIVIFLTAIIFVGVDPVQVESAAVNVIFTTLALGMTLLGVAAQVYRYQRVSGPVEKQQTKWVLVGFLGLALSVVVWMFTQVFFLAEPGPLRVALNVINGLGLVFLLPLLPASMVLAILRYRLWDVDVIIRKTLVYGSLTTMLVALYFGNVLLLQTLLTTLTGQQTTIAIVISTLAIAALFNPLRRRIQDFIDRRFYRQKYDAEKALAAFSLTVREEVDLESLSEELLSMVAETMQPESVSVWIRAAPE